MMDGSNKCRKLFTKRGAKDRNTLLFVLFMVIETFRDRKAIGERFERCGRMLPEGVTYHAS